MPRHYAVASISVVYTSKDPESLDVVLDEQIRIDEIWASDKWAAVEGISRDKKTGQCDEGKLIFHKELSDESMEIWSRISWSGQRVKYAVREIRE